MSARAPRAPKLLLEQQRAGMSANYLAANKSEGFRRSQCEGKEHFKAVAGGP